MSAWRNENRLGVVHTGGFSGITQSLISALRATGVGVEVFDLSRLPRSPRALPARLGAELIAANQAYGWSRTPQWASAVSRAVDQLPAIPLLFVQTLLACKVDPQRRYVVFTDRISAESDAEASRWSPVNHPAWLAQEWEFLRKAEHVFVMGPSSKECLLRHGFDEGCITITGGGPNAELPTLRDRSDENPSRLLFVGAQWERKGGPQLVSALDRIRSLTRHRPTLDVVGCAPELSRPYLTVHGFMDPSGVGKLLDRAHLFTMLSHSEAFGIAYLEAVASGVPVLGPLTNNVPWIVGGAGLCVDPEDSDAVDSALLQLLENYPTYAQAAADRGRSIRTTASWGGIASRITAHLFPSHATPPTIRPMDGDKASTIAVMATYNRYDSMTESLHTVRNQTHPPDAIVVVDNGSPDNTANRVAKEFPDVTVIAMGENMGPGAALAAGMRRAVIDNPEYIWLVEDDTIYDPGYLQEALAIMTTNPSLQLLGGQGWDFDGRLWTGEPQRLGRLVKGALPTLDGLLVRQKAALQAGFPAENFFIMIQDIEYPLRMVEQGHEVAVAPNLASRPLRLGASSLAGGPHFRAYYQTRNHLRMALDRRSMPLGIGFCTRSAYLLFGDLRREDTIARLAMRLAGAIDALRGRMGRTVEPGDRWPWTYHRRRRHV